MREHQISSKKTLATLFIELPNIAMHSDVQGQAIDALSITFKKRALA